MNKAYVRKYSLGVLSALAVSLAIWVPESRAQNNPPILQPTPNQPNPRSAYVCPAGTGGLHDVSDLKGGDSPQHQTGGSPRFTCIAASLPGGTSGHYTCPGGPHDLHLVSDLKGGVEQQHQTGNPPYTCLVGALPQCAAYNVPTKNNGQPLTPGDTCMPAPPK
jgi:hypothetical protein